VPRVAAYIDGFNLYHAIKDLRQPHLKWLNLWSVSESFLLSGESLVAVNYFSAYATWLPDEYSRHRQYVAALEHYGVSVSMAKFKETRCWCSKCKHQWIKHNEKETDVHVAIRLVADAIQDRFDRAILISADSDLAPAVRLVRAETKKQVLVVAPPKRFTKARDLNPAVEMTVGRVKKNLMAAVLYGPDGSAIATRPAEYDPPVPVSVI
jgi:uncharacterized LabA/DUF88 family protein